MNKEMGFRYGIDQEIINNGTIQVLNYKAFDPFTFLLTGTGWLMEALEATISAVRLKY